MADFQAMIKTELVGKDLLATVQKMNDATCYAIIPRTLEDDKGLTLDEAISQIAEFVKNLTKSDTPPFTEGSIQEALKAFVDISKVTLVLRQAYVFVKKHSEEQEKAKDITEYAFNIAVFMDDGEFEQTEGSLFKVKELSFAVWSCDRQKILDSMDIVDLSDIDKAIDNAARFIEEKKTSPQITMREDVTVSNTVQESNREAVGHKEPEQEEIQK